MKNGHAGNTADELEPQKMIFITHSRIWIYLQSVIIPEIFKHKVKSSMSVMAKASNAIAETFL